MNLKHRNRTRDYAAVCKKVSLILGVPYVDLWEGFEGTSSQRQEYLSDGLHLSAKYSRFMPPWTIDDDSQGQ